ncbi:MAG: hypothetical protein ABIH72_00685 [archaeon]
MELILENKMGLNRSKIMDLRFWDRWRASGAVGNIESAKSPRKYNPGDIVRLTARAPMGGYNQEYAYSQGEHTEGMILRQIPKGESFAGWYEIVTTSYTPSEKDSWIFRFPLDTLEGIPGDSRLLREQMKKELLRRGYEPALRKAGLAA